MNSPHKAGAGTALPASSTTAAAAASHQPLTRRIRLVKRHIHAGLPKGPGEDIELLHDLADWLVAEGAAQEIESVPAPPPTPIAASAAPISPTPAPTPVSTPKKEK